MTMCGLCAVITTGATRKMNGRTTKSFQATGIYGFQRGDTASEIQHVKAYAKAARRQDGIIKKSERVPIVYVWRSKIALMRSVGPVIKVSGYLPS